MRISLYLVGAAIAFLLLQWALYLWTLRQHQGMTRAEFVSYFSSGTRSTLIAGIVYDYFRRLTGIRSFEPHPLDSLSKTYRTGGDDLDDVLGDLVQQLGWELPHSGILSEWFDPLDNLEDLVRFLDWIGTVQSPGASMG